MNIKKIASRTCLATALATSTLLSGCAALTQKSGAERIAAVKEEEASFLDKIPFVGKRDSTPKPYPNPVKLAATWTPDTLYQTARTPTRGFGGRLFFFNEKSKAVPVEGTLVVHAFDERAVREEDRVKRFEFTPEQLTRHYGRSDIGASYSVWIPIDAVGGERRELSLVTSFVNTEGKTVQSSPAKVVLQGHSPEPQTDLATRYSPKFQSWKQAQTSGAARRSGLVTTTIERSPMGQRDGSAPADRTTERIAGVSETGGTPTATVMMRRGGTRVTPPQSTVLPASATMPRRLP